MLFKTCLIAIFSTLLFNMSLTHATTDIQISGFQIIENNSQFLKVKFREEREFILSKKKFTSEKTAKEFCGKINLSLDPNGLNTTLLLAMSGAALLNQDIEREISFKLSDQISGIWAWVGNNDLVEVMRDGKGGISEKVKFSEIYRIAQSLGKPEVAALPAICK